MIRTIGTGLATALIAIALAGIADRASASKTQTFDTEASAAADGWVGANNRVPAYGTDFGWSDSNLAGGASGAGEAGGYFPRHNLPVAYYADVEIGTASLNQPLVASGKIVFFTENLDGGVRLGFFNKEIVDGGNNLPPMVGINFAEGPRFQPVIRLQNSAGVSGALTNPGIGSNVTDFLISWNPATRILSASFGGVSIDSPVLSQAQIDLGATVNAFGLFTGAAGTDIIDRRARVFIDDITYSVGVPEPTTMILLGLGLPLAICARRKENAA